MTKTALIVGATGVVGRALVTQLCEHDAYQRVIVWVRRPLAFSHPKLTVRIVDFEGIDAIPIEPIDDVFCALGTTKKQAGSREQFWRVDVDYPLAVARWAKQAGASQCILISSPGANATSPLLYLRAKGEAESGVRALAFERVLIIHPPIIMGQRADKRLAETVSARILLRLPATWLPTLRPMTGDAIARAVCGFAQHTQHGCFIRKPCEWVAAIE